MIKMPVLKEVFEQAGFEDVATYVQSGNVVFSADGADVRDLAERIHQLLKQEKDMDVPVIVLAPEDLKRVFETNPFLAGRDEDIAKLHVTFLGDKPEKERVDKIDPEKYLPDEFTIDGKTIFLYCPNGYGRTKLHNNFFESKLKVKATTRNWKTVTELSRLANDLAASL